MSQLALTNIINVSVSQAPRGLGAFNVNNLALFTRETPVVSIPAGYAIYRTYADVVTDWGSSSVTAMMAANVFSQQPNILAGGGYLVIIPYLSLETLGAALTRTESLVQYFGAMSEDIVSDADITAAATVVEAMNKILFVVKKTSGAVAPSGIFDTIQSAGDTKVRCLLYLQDPGTDLPALGMQAAYAGRALSTNFSGSNTTQTMHLKDLINVNPDLTITQTIVEECKTTGTDFYGSFEGIPKVYSTGGNQFFDRVYNLGWLVGALQVATFNALATSSNKVPQTEQGVSVLKGAVRNVAEQGVTNQYIAPGSWTSPDTFGNLNDFLRNINEKGYYIYSLPVSQQSPTDRAARLAPLIQLALKEAGAIHQSDILVNINP